MKYFIILISLGLLGAATVLTTQMIGLAKENQELKTDLAEINHVRYGLLNADQWRDQVALILGKKILEMDLAPENRVELQGSLEVIMYGLLDDLEIIIKERTSGQFSSMKRMVLAISEGSMRRFSWVCGMTTLSMMSCPMAWTIGVLVKPG